MKYIGKSFLYDALCDIMCWVLTEIFDYRCDTLLFLCAFLQHSTSSQKCVLNLSSIYLWTYSLSLVVLGLISSIDTQNTVSSSTVFCDSSNCGLLEVEFLGTYCRKNMTSRTVIWSEFYTSNSLNLIGWFQVTSVFGYILCWGTVGLSTFCVIDSLCLNIKWPDTMVRISTLLMNFKPKK